VPDFEEGLDMTRLGIALGAACCLFSIAGPSGAQTTGRSDCEILSVFSRTSFIAADQNGDGVVSEAEFASDVAAAFAGQDRNMDGSLRRAELPDAPSGAFERIDRDRNGALSFRELMLQKLAEFERADANKDGVLAIEEVMRFNVVQHGGC
jgi:Ca2+-binding EF-hand superfamily protein